MNDAAKFFFAAIAGTAAYVLLARQAGAAESPQATYTPDYSTYEWDTASLWQFPVFTPAPQESQGIPQYADEWGTWMYADKPAYYPDFPIDEGLDYLPDAPYSPPGVLSTFVSSFSGYSFDAVNNPNVQAFLAVIRTSETGNAGPEAYNQIFGGQTFADFADHPRVAVQSPWGWTSAAGAYQFLARSPIPGTLRFTRWDTWGEAQRALNLPDFSPASQDLAAIYLIKRRGALADVIAGRFTQAIAKTAKEWASLPGAGYGQPEVAIDKLRTIYLANGGNIETV